MIPHAATVLATRFQLGRRNPTTEPACPCNQPESETAAASDLARRLAQAAAAVSLDAADFDVELDDGSAWAVNVARRPGLAPEMADDDSDALRDETETRRTPFSPLVLRVSSRGEVLAIPGPYYVDADGRVFMNGRAIDR